MRNKILVVNHILLLTVILAIQITPVYAQSPTVMPTTAIATVNPGKKANPPGASIGATNKATARQQIVTRITALSNRMLSRANDALLRLDNIWARVQSRIEKFKAAGKDVSSLAGWIQQVDAKRKAAADAIANANTPLTTIDSSASPKNTVKSFISTFKNVKTALKAYHQAILTVITNIKGMSAQTGTGPSVIPSVTTIPTLLSPISTSNPVIPTSTPVPLTAGPT